ncbi:peptidoglycan-binding protein [Pseudomonas sp. 7P_10.2_Bac1]|uniref:FimV/HubP family polar landmark protein n=1 Tax=Pseudomonas sp. 7P_10.2_Bac1 TaxID=2971614 RepID=UPI0021C8A216|nr:FimV/HubP family polar landmark protein [Pseudomonas sp. 7P_10.2_Bac1]MCU1729685.1 peptidoglycan-binding protein [Pseudomonas sp. 7P_10.2_Bac1]
MVQVRKLVLAIAAASALSSGMAQALGLGELTLKSAQNQPLLAEIELLDVKDLNAAEVVPSLAPADEFSKAGVPRPDYLNDLRFTPVINANGKSVLRVTSSQPLSEPFVKFLVQVMWPNGRLMRDYSVLLDPAKYSPQTAAAAAATSVATAAAAPGAEAGQYTTSSRDTLWEIAAKARNGGSVQQTMLAIQALNPDAFIGGNINRLKTGQVLRLPNAAQSVELSQSKAVAEVASQNADWRSGRRTAPRAQQLDATARTPQATPVAKTQTKDGLSLVAGQAGKGAGGDAKNINDKLAMTQESLDTSRRESAELQSRVKDLQSQVDKLQRLIELKNNQLAKLQGEAATPLDAGAALPAHLVGEAADTPEDDIAPATEGAAATAVAPAPQGATPSDERKLQDLLASPLLTVAAGGAAVLLLLLLLLLLVRRRKAQQAAERHARMARALEEEEPDFAADFDLPQSSFEGIEVPPPSVKLDAAPTPSPVPPAPAPAPTPVVAPVAAPDISGAEVLVEAERLIQQQQFHEAAGLLEGAVSHAPQRSDLRLKLMQVYGELGEREAFIAQERQLVANGKNYAEVAQLKLRYPAMAAVAAGIVAAAVASQFQADFVREMMRDDRVVEPEPQLKPTPVVTPPDEEFDHDFDLSLDDLEAASPTQLSPDQSAAKLASEHEQSFDAVLKQQAETQSALDKPTDFDLDLPDDFDLSLAEEAPVVPQAPEAPEAPDSFSIELDKVNAELQRLSQSLEEPAMAEPFAQTVAGADEEPEFDFLSGADEAATKLDLAQAYIDMGDDEGARDILTEVMGEGSPEQQAEAIELLSRLA